VALTHVARVAARAAVLDPRPGSVRSAAVAASSLDARRLAVTVRRGSAGRVTVVVAYRSPTDVPLIGPLLGDVTFTERLVGQVEQ
jgi:acetyl-CoA acetyltransferase